MVDLLYTIYRVTMVLMMATLTVMLASYLAVYINRAFSLRRKQQTFTLKQMEVIDLKDGSRQGMRFRDVTAVRIHTTFLQNLIRTGNITFESGSGPTRTLTDVTHHRAAALELMAFCPKLPEAQRFAQSALITASRSWRPQLQIYAEKGAISSS